MSYAIVFTGEINDAMSKDAVVSNLAALFKQDQQFIEKLFSGKQVVIKRGLDQQSANKYLAAISQAGAIAKIISQEATKVDAAPGTQNEAPATRPSTEPSTKSVAESQPLSMAEPGSTIIEYQHQTEPVIDITGISMSPAGEQITSPDYISPPEIDTSNMDLLPSGSQLSTEKKPDSPDIDTTGMSMAEPGTRVIDSDKDHP